MAWQDVFPVSSPRIAAEEDRELRLAIQARAGAEWALTALVARYQPPVTRYLTRLTGDTDLARALAERVFVRMERRLHGPEGGRHLRLWLLRASTEAGLDALRHPPAGRAASQLMGPARPAGLLAEAGGQRAMQRLKAGLGALAQATAQTRRQVRKLVWSAAPDAAPKPGDLDLQSRGRAAPDASGEEGEAGGVGDGAPEQDPREALRYRIVRAVLAELPYGDAQCLALHLVAGLNQAEVAAALGLANSATRRRIVQGLQLFAQRFNAAAASLGISPDALADLEASPPDAVAGGYDAVREPSGDSFVPSFAPSHADRDAPQESAAAPAVASAGEPGIVEADAFVVDALPLALPVAPASEPEEEEDEEWEAEPAISDPSDNEIGAPSEGSSEAGPLAPENDPVEVTLPGAGRIVAPSPDAEASESAVPEGTAAGPALAADDVTTPLAVAEALVLAAAAPDDGADRAAASADDDDDDDEAAPETALAPATRLIPDMAPPPIARLIPVTTPVHAPQAEAADATAARPASEARVIPVLTPQARHRDDTVPRLRRGEQPLAESVANTGVGARGHGDG